MLETRKQGIAEESTRMKNAFDAFREANVGKSELLEYLEF